MLVTIESCRADAAVSVAFPLKREWGLCRAQIDAGKRPVEMPGGALQIVAVALTGQHSADLDGRACLALILGPHPGD
jgi:hypothetical protein